MKSMEQKNLKIPLPKHIEAVCKKIEDTGYAAYAVGGCVRDFLRGIEPHDYDIASAAPPEEIMRIFPRTVETGISHGTVTVILPEGPVEITTFRADGQYTDKRRPDAVSFSKDIKTDLARRDFTVNAMAYSPFRGFCDPYHGLQDLQNQILRTVGDPMTRFSEDALRILRLFRFCAQLSFFVEPETENAAKALVSTLSFISKERIYAELEKLLVYGKKDTLLYAFSVLASALPAISVTPETMDAVANCKFMAGKWAHLFENRAEASLRMLRAKKSLCLAAGELSKIDRQENVALSIVRLRHARTEELFDFLQDKNKEQAWKNACSIGAPKSMEDLALSGEDMKKLGYCGKEIRKALEMLFLHATENPADNNRNTLWEVGKWLYKERKLPKA